MKIPQYFLLTEICIISTLTSPELEPEKHFKWKRRRLKKGQDGNGGGGVVSKQLSPRYQFKFEDLLRRIRFKTVSIIDFSPILQIGSNIH